MVTHGGYLYGLQVGCGSVIMPRVRSESMGRVHVGGSVCACSLIKRRSL